MAEPKKKKRQSIAESLKELRGMGTNSQNYKDTAEREKNKMLAISKNKKLSEPAKAKLNETKGVGPVRDGAAYGKNIRGSGIGPVSDGRSYARQIETKGAGPVKDGGEYAKSIAKPKPKPKPGPVQSAKTPVRGSEQTTTTTTSNSRKNNNNNNSGSSNKNNNNNNRRFTSATSNLFISKEASEAQSKYTPKSKPPKPKSSDFPPTARGTEQFAAALRAWNKKYG